MTVRASLASTPGDIPAEAAGPPCGALVISLDFEIHWGLRDQMGTGGPYRQNLLGVREAVPRMLEMFAEFEVAATWATVGFLFAASRDELERSSPALKPSYTDPALSPYAEPLGRGEADDPFHFAPSLIDEVRATPRQELETHTFSHYYTLAPGQSAAEFAADLRSAREIAARRGVEFRSIVFPRNQHNPAYDPVLLDAGLLCYRGLPRAHPYRGDSAAQRLVRLGDAYVDVAGEHTTPWAAVPQESGLCNVPGSFFLRPFVPRLRHADGLRLRRMARAIRGAALRREIVHLWWHPHNFGRHTDENLAFLRRLLEVFAQYRESHGMRSMGMTGAALAALRGEGR